MDAPNMIILGMYKETIPDIRYERHIISRESVGYGLREMAKIWRYSNDTMIWRWTDGLCIQHSLSLEDAKSECDGNLQRLYPGIILCETEDEEEKYGLLI